MKFLKRLLYIILAIVAVVLIVALFLSKVANIESSIKIGISSDKVFQMIATYSHRSAWDPWVEIDSSTKVTIENVDGYIGSKYSWDGEKVGTGQEVIDSIDFGKHIKSLIRFGGMEGVSVNEWDFIPKGDSTDVIWSFSTEGNYPIGRIFLVLMKSQLKGNFNKGLENLKKYLEENGFNLAYVSDFGVIEYPAMQAMGIKTKLKMAEIESAMGDMFTNLMNEVAAEKLIISGPPFSHYFNLNRETNETELIVGVPVMKTGKGNDQVVAFKYPAMKVVKALHTGPYQEFESSYNKLMNYATENNIKIKWEAWETYLTDPSMEPNPMKWQTVIAFPLE